MRSALFVVCLVLAVGIVEGHRPHDEVTAMAVSKDGNTIFAVVREAFLRSTDSGRTWQWRGVGIDIRKIRVYVSPTFDVDSRVFVHSRSGVYRSDDGGDSYKLLPGSPTSDKYARLVFSPTGTVFACGGVGGVGGLFMSTNAGDDWTATGFGSNCASLVATNQGLIVAKLDGSVFAASYTDLSSSTSFVYLHQKTAVLEFAVAEDAVETHVLVGTLRDVNLLKVNMSTRRMISWTALNVRNTFVTYPTNIPFGVSVHDSRWYVLPPTGNFFLRSEDKGATWQQIGPQQGIMSDPQAAEYPVTQFGFLTGAPGKKRVFLGAFSGVHMSNDNGRTWGPLNTLNSQITSLAAACADRACNFWTIGVCSYANGCFRASVDKAILKTASDPRTAAKLISTGQAPGKGEYTVNAMSRDFANDRVEFRGYANMLYSSSDNWQTFAQFGFRPFHNNRDKATVNHITPATNNVIFVTGYNLGAQISNDKGRTFRVFSAAPRGTTHLVISDKWAQDGTMAASHTDSYTSHFGSLAWTIGKGWFNISDSTGVWMDLAVFRGNDSQYPVVVGLRDPNARVASGGKGDPLLETVEIWRTDSSMRLIRLEQTPYKQYRPLGFSENSLLFHPVANETDSRVMYASFLVGGSRTGTVRFGTTFWENEIDSNPPINYQAAESDYEAGSRRKFAGFLNGGAESSMVSFDAESVEDKNEANAGRRSSLPGAKPFLNEPLSPKAGKRGSPGRLVVASPKFLEDNIMFASGYYTISFSTDGGINWRELISLRHVQQGRECLDLSGPATNCNYCRQTQPKVCLECANGSRRRAYNATDVSPADWPWFSFRCVPDSVRGRGDAAFRHEKTSA